MLVFLEGHSLLLLSALNDAIDECGGSEMKVNVAVHGQRSRQVPFAAPDLGSADIPQKYLTIHTDIYSLTKTMHYKAVIRFTVLLALASYHGIFARESDNILDCATEECIAWAGKRMNKEP
ncbi:hypothetical protein ARMGADRAFT_1028467 [Armillaria gallica]|uniref:Uncharacterized protein n=1 Tax=Armillaria gallica TaxID=47427 RepID=A0A2H3DIH6_ARMGA|nr:hypothetical protein ARMGADRAFT_1028467 [Armillaria gallica]